MSQVLTFPEANNLIAKTHPWIAVSIGNKKHHGATINYAGVIKHRLSHVIGMEGIAIFGESKVIVKERLLDALDNLVKKSKDVDTHIEMHNKYAKELEAAIERLEPSHYDHDMNKRFLADNKACLVILHAVKEKRAPVFAINSQSK